MAMEVSVRNRLVCGVFLVAAMFGASVRPAAAQDKGVLVGVGVAFLHDDTITYTGVAADVAKDVRTLEKGSVSVVGDIGFYSNEVTISSYAGGVRFTGQLSPKASAFGQFLIGAEHCCGETNMLLAPGVGLDYVLTPKLNFRAEINFNNVRFDGGSFNEQRYFFGISTKLGSN